MIYVLVTGLLIGMAHALEADHLAAVASMSARATSKWRILWHAVSWGLGHTITLFVIVVPVVLLEMTVDPKIESGLEAVVGLVLVGLGTHLLWRMRRDRVHIHVHSHGDRVEHMHFHSHKGEGVEHEHSSHQHRHGSKLSLKSLSVGLIHGMAGSAALAVLAVTEIGTAWLVVPFVLFFGIGSIAGMALVSQVVFVPLHLASRFGNAALLTVQGLSAVAAIGVGAMFAYFGSSALLSA